MIRHLFTFFFSLLFLFRSNAQIDTSFWFVAPDISATMGQSPIVLNLETYSQAATVYVRQPANLTATGVNVTLIIPAGSLGTIDLTPSITAVESTPANTVTSKGLYISSTSNISAYYTIGSASNKELISLKGRRALGTDFFTPIPATYSSVVTPTDAGVGFDIVATDTGITTLLITPRAACAGRAKNVTFVKTLNQGQTFSMRDNKAVNPSQLSGSIVSSDKLIALTIVGAITTNSCQSLYTDQLTSTSNIGKDYVLLQGHGTGDVGYILAPFNSTSLTITSGTVTNWLINSGETFSVPIGSPMTYVNTDQPVYMLHLSGYGCKLAGAQLAPVVCVGSYTSAFVRLSNDSLNLNIVTRSGYESSFTLTSNGTNVPISATSFTPVPGSVNLVAARIYEDNVTIPQGSYNLLRNSADIFGLSTTNGDPVNGSAYANSSEFGASSFAIANPVPTATICSNTQFTLNGVVGGGPITGAWSTNGLGSFTQGSTQLINNIYVPDPVDTNITPVKIILTSTGVCPNKSDTLKLTVRQGPIVTAGSNQVICSNNATVQLSGNVYGATNQGVWSAVAPGNGTFVPSVNSFTPLYKFSNSDTAQAYLNFVLTSTNNSICNAVRDTVQVIINKAPIVTASSINPLIICSNNATISLNGAVSGTTTSTGRWLSSGTGLFVPDNLSLSTSYLPSLADLAAGSIYLRLESTNNVYCNPIRDSVHVFFTQPSIPNAGVDINSCKNNARASLNAVITGTATNSGIWLGGSGTFLPSSAALTATYYATPLDVAAGFVVLTFSTTGNGICNGNSDDVKITFQDKPTADFTVTSVCLNLPTIFTDGSLNTSGLGALSGWQWDLGDSTFITNIVNPSHTYSVAGSYTAILIVNNTFNCYDTTQKQVIVFGAPTASMSISRACSGAAELITFQDQSSIPPPDNIPSNGYYWDFGGQGFSNSKDTAVIFPSEGIYGVTHIVTTINNCKSVVTQSVNITAKPKARFKIINNSTLSLGATISFLDSSNIVPNSWSWQLGNGETSNIKDPVATYSANGTYTVSLTISDQFGCTDTYTSTVSIKSIADEITELIPNIITPNGDGKNDIWRLDFIDVFFPTAEIEIYSRWGAQLFHSIGYADAWNGSYKGTPLPVGAYFYIIKLNNKENDIYKGTITLIK